MQITTTIEFYCRECGEELSVEPTANSEKFEIDCCKSCTEHGSARAMDTIENGEDGRVYFNGKAYGRLQFAELIRRMTVAVGLEHSAELQAQDSTRDQREDPRFDA
jgi:ribosomal protein L31